VICDEPNHEINQLAANALPLETAINRQPCQLDGGIVLVSERIQNVVTLAQLLNGHVRA
jgi:hypothetical protein